MRALLWVVLGFGVLWGGYWWLGSTALERGAEAWFVNAQAQGLVAERDSMAVRGFPNRFDLTVNGLHLADPATGWGWDAPFAQLFAMTWKPWHLIAALPPSQVITTPLEKVTLTSTRMMGSLVLHPGTDLALNRMVVEGEGLVALSDLGWTVGVEKLVASTSEDPSRRFSHRVGLNVTRLTPDAAVSGLLPDLPGVVDLIQLDAYALLTAPLDRHAGKTLPQLTGIELDALEIRWGGLWLSAKGSVAVASEGFAEGRIDIRVENWRHLPPVLAALGLVKPEVAPTIERALEIMARGSLDPQVLDLPLIFKSGRMSLGLLPLGPAPKLAQRQ